MFLSPSVDKHLSPSVPLVVLGFWRIQLETSSLQCLEIRVEERCLSEGFYCCEGIPWLQQRSFRSLVWFLFVCLFEFFETGFPCSPDCPGILSVDQAGLVLKDLPAPTSLELGLEAGATTTLPR